MNLNINKVVQGKQRRLFAFILGGIVLVMGTLWFLNNRAASSAEAQQAGAPEGNGIPEPDLTGAITNTFDGDVQGGVLVDSQLREREASKAVEDMKTAMLEIKKQLDEMKGNNDGLKTQLSDMQAQLEQAKQQQASTPAKTDGGVGGGSALPPAQYQLGPPPVSRGQIDSPLFDYSAIDKPKKRATGAFYVPTGTFSNAIIIEGADANASVRGQEKLVPMQFKLKGLAHLPGNQKSDKLANCFVTASAFGEISSERAEVKTERLSCVINGKHIDQEVEGHVSFYGKNGIKGIPVMRNGKLLGLSFMGGALSGLGQTASQVGQTVAGVGATSTISAGDAGRAAIGGGASTAGGKLADYYIQRAEQYHPIIPIGAGNRVEVVFQKGFKAEFIEDIEEAEKQANTSAEQPAQAGSADTTTQSQGNSGLPPELLGKLGDAAALKLQDFVTPAPGAPQNSG
ncbi:TrbI/VirB10 family protein [Serratia marcescens]|uniref:TrbI/VirB10 family protein n=1 Tax=Serratia marcescens TaxID=615 RepID=UPI0032048B95